MRTVLQIPLSQDLKVNAEKAAKSSGFSSLQELVRVFLSKVATRKIEVTIQESVELSGRNEKRYLKMSSDFEKNKNIYSAKDIEDLIRKLHANSVS